MNKKQRSEAQAYCESHRECAVCWWPESDLRRPLHLHHIVGGFARAKGNDKKNYLRLCKRCHDVHHDGKVAGNFPPITLAVILWVKREVDQSIYDHEYLSSLRNKKHLGHDPSPPSEFYFLEREANIGPWKQRRP